MTDFNYQHLQGIPFVHGTQDCYGLIRQYFRERHQIQLRDYARPDKWWNQGLNLYMENFHNEGFETIDIHPRDMRVSDCWLMAIRAEMANHAGIYVGNGLMLHHYYGRLSEAELYKGVWRNHTVAVVRQKSVPEVKNSNNTIDLVSLLPPALREKITSATPTDRN